MSSNDIKSASIDYSQNFHLPIIPLCSYDHSDMSFKHKETCFRPGKRPIFKGWNKSYIPSIKTINSWFEKVPNCNIGVVTGSNSGIVAIDTDGELGQKMLKQISNNNLPKTWLFTTPGGGTRHLYRIPNGLVLKKYQKSLGNHNECALLGEGQMTVLPPSIHENGGIYEWVAGHAPSEINLAAAPQWMVSLMQHKTEENLSDTSFHDVSAIEQGKVLDKLSNGCARFQTDLQLQKQIGLSEEEWFRWLSLLTSTGYHEVALTFSKYSDKHDKNSELRLNDLSQAPIAGMIRCTTLGCNKKQIEKCFNGNIRVNQVSEITNSPGSLIYKKSGNKSHGSYTQAQLKKIGFIFNEKTNKPMWVNENIYASHVLQVMSLLYFGPGERFYNYNNGLWQTNDYNLVARKLRNLLHSYVQNIWTMKMEKGYMEALIREAPRVEKLDSNRNFINLENGMLNLNTLLLEKHEKEFYSTIRVPIYYDPEAQCPQFIKFLNEVFEQDHERVELVSQIFGYCLTSETKAQKAFIFYGKGSNGKSVLIDLLLQLCGKENVSAVTLKELDNPFSRFELLDKLLNISTENEVGSGELNTQYLKAIVAGDPIRVEKKHETGFMYQPFCKLVFGLNNLPYSKDKSYGFQRRLIIVPFDRTFDTNEQDVDLPIKLQKELPGILNFALKGLESLKKNNYKFVESKAVSNAVEAYSEQLNPIRAFVNEMIVAGDYDDRILNRSLKEAFSNWCDDNGINTQYNGPTVLNRIRDVLKDKHISFSLDKGSGGQRGLKGIRWSQKYNELNEKSLEVDDIELFDI
jgi:P4 family phage/plasmid primase-like protien